MLKRPDTILTETERQNLADEIARSSLGEAARRRGTSKETLARAVAGIPARPGSIALIRSRARDAA